jgi:predicted enzyme related to lactoylglutathione lyase
LAGIPLYFGNSANDHFSMNGLFLSKNQTFMKKNAVSWFEIPVTDMKRAKKFYMEVLKADLSDAQMHGMEMAMFQWVQGAPYAAGSLIKADHRRPSAEGISVYFQCDDLSDELSRVEKNGGKIVTPKFSLGEWGGFAAHVLDSEGNGIGLSSEK